MTVTEQPPGDTTPKLVAQPEPSGPSVRTVLAGTGTIAALIAGVVLFVAGGWVAVAVGSAVGLGGTAAVIKAKSMRPHKTRPGLIASWLGRTRRTTTTRTRKGFGSLPWSLTGNQSKRAKTGRAGGPKLPAVSAKGRARRAVQAATGKAPGRKSDRARPVARKSPGGRPAGPGKTRSGTPTKTPAKASTGNRPRVTTPKPKLPVRPGGNGTGRPRLAAAKKTTSRPVSNGGKGATVLPFKRPAKKTAGGGTPVAVRRTGASARRNATTRPGVRGLGAAKRLGSRRTGTGVASRAKRLATPKARRPRSNDLAVPKRTTRAPHRKAPSTKRHLIRTALRVPARTKGLRFKRPTKTSATRAKRALWRRSRIAGRRALTWPGRSIRAAWRSRKPLPFWPTLPTPIQDAWKVPNVADPRLTRERPIRPPKHRAPYPQKTARRVSGTPKGTPMNPIEAITEAYAQLTNFDPDNAREIEAFMAALGPAHEQAASSLREFASRLTSDNPVHASVGSAVDQVASLLGGAGEIGGEANSTFLSVHAADLARLNEPRAGEHKWDSSLNQ